MITETAHRSELQVALSSVLNHDFPVDQQGVAVAERRIDVACLPDAADDKRRA